MKGVDQMDQMTVYNQLNDFILLTIQANGMVYVVDNYIYLREQYYCTKAQ